MRIKTILATLVLFALAAVLIAAVNSSPPPVAQVSDEYLYYYQLDDVIYWKGLDWTIRGFLTDKSLIDGKIRHYYRVYRYGGKNYYMTDYVWIGYVEPTTKTFDGSERETDPPPADCPMPPPC